MIMNIMSANPVTAYNTYRHAFLTLSLLTIIACCNPVRASTASDKDWRFKVFLDDDEIGYHNFSMINTDVHKEIYSSARFNVKFFFINAYSYEHDNVEQWKGGCLKSINSVTNDNGDKYIISGTQDNGAFTVNKTQSQDSYPGCIKTFAYWDPGFLHERSLLNAQTGEMIEVESSFIGNETITHKGEPVSAKRYRLTGDRLQIDLWYSDDNHWLALESLTENNHIIRYAMP